MKLVHFGGWYRTQPAKAGVTGDLLARDERRRARAERRRWKGRFVGDVPNLDGGDVTFGTAVPEEKDVLQSGRLLAAQCKEYTVCLMPNARRLLPGS